MIRALPAGRRIGATTLGVVGALFLTVGLGGCPGTLDPSLLDAGLGRGGSSGGGGSGGQTAADAPAIFAKYMCSQNGCHDSAGTSSGFDMASSGWETRLVGVNPKSTSQLCATNGPYLGSTLPAMGLFLGKLTSSPPCGVQMPFLGPTYLSAAEVAIVQTWANGLVMAKMGGGGTDAGRTDGGGGQ